MNQETYKAVKRIMEWASDRLLSTKEKFTLPIAKDINQVEAWIDEVAKEYEEEESQDVYQVIANSQKLYYKKTDGGAEYLCKKAIEGTEIGDIKTAVIRLDGGAELV